MEETWIECTDIAIPKDSTFTNHHLFNQFDSIDGSYIDIDSLVITKVASYYDRIHIQLTDMNDVEQIVTEGYKLTEKMIVKAIHFITDTRPSPIDKERLDEIKSAFNVLIQSDES